MPKFYCLFCIFVKKNYIFTEGAHIEAYSKGVS